MIEYKDYIINKLKHPFWWASLTYLIVINYELYVYTVYEFDRVDLVFFNEHLKGYFDVYTFKAIGVGLLNALVGPSIIQILNVASFKIFDLSQHLYLWLQKESVVAKHKYDQIKNEKAHIQDKLNQVESERDSIDGDFTAYRNTNDDYKAKLNKRDQEIANALRSWLQKLDNSTSGGNSVAPTTRRDLDYLIEEIKNSQFYDEESANKFNF